MDDGTASRTGGHARHVAGAAREHDGPAAEVAVGRSRRDSRRRCALTDVTVVCVRTGAPRHRGEARDEVDHLGHRHVAVGIRAVVAIAGQSALPVGRQQPQRVPALAPPGVRHLAALEHDVIDRALGETAARREPGVPGADDDRRDLFDGSAPLAAAIRLDDFDGDVRRVGDDVVHRRALLRLRDDRLDVLLATRPRRC